MLTGDHRIFHPGCFGHLCPLAGLVKIRIKHFKILLIVFIGHPLIPLHPFVPGRHRIQTPMDEHPKTVMGPPGHAFLLLLRAFNRQLCMHCRVNDHE